MPKAHSQRPGFTWPLIWVAMDIPSTYLFTNENKGKNPSFFYLTTTGHRAQNKAVYKHECQKGGKGRKMWRKIAIDMLRQTEKSSIVWSFCLQQQG